MVDSTKDEELMLLASLPPSYEHFQKTMMIGKSTLTFEEVVQDLIHHELPQNYGDSSQGAGRLT